MVARLRELLGGDDAMPTAYNPNRGKQPDGSGNFNDAPFDKTYTLCHGAGFGMLWQLTDEKKYTELGKQCVEKALDGQRNRDNRYSFRAPTGALRAGSSLGAIAMAYDLCCDGWDDAFRNKVALEIQNYNEGQFISLSELSHGKRLGPQSNHWRCQIGNRSLAHGKRICRRVDLIRGWTWAIQRVPGVGSWPSASSRWRRWCANG